MTNVIKLKHKKNPSKLLAIVKDFVSIFNIQFYVDDISWTLLLTIIYVYRGSYQKEKKEKKNNVPNIGVYCNNCQRDRHTLPLYQWKPESYWGYSMYCALYLVWSLMLRTQLSIGWCKKIEFRVQLKHHENTHYGIWS